MGAIWSCPRTHGHVDWRSRESNHRSSNWLLTALPADPQLTPNIKLFKQEKLTEMKKLFKRVTATSKHFLLLGNMNKNTLVVNNCAAPWFN